MVLGAIIAAALVFVTCFAVPLAMNSNIWPIAGAFWSAICVPLAAAVGALLGWLVRHQRSGVVAVLLVMSAAALSIATGVIIANTR